jgi:hypothetical protein
MPSNEPELALIQDELDALVVLRRLTGLTRQERVRYEELGDREVELLHERGRESVQGPATGWRASLLHRRSADWFSSAP